jgi:hypothetical protein
VSSLCGRHADKKRKRKKYCICVNRLALRF